MHTEGVEFKATKVFKLSDIYLWGPFFVGVPVRPNMLKHKSASRFKRSRVQIRLAPQ